MKKSFVITGVCLIILITICEIWKEPIVDFIYDLFDNKEYVVATPNDYFWEDNFNYVEYFDGDPSNKKELLDYIYYVINTGSEYADGECTDEYTDCMKDIVEISKDNAVLSILNDYVHPYNSFKTITINYCEDCRKKTFSLEINHMYNKKEIEIINNKVDSILNTYIKDSMSTSDKIKVIHDYIIDNTTYDKLKADNENDTTYKSNTAYGVLIEGYGICSGYTDTMAIFLDRLNIPNYKVSNDDHVWNLVYVNGAWLHLDLTWDDPISSTNKNRDTYFLITTGELNTLNDGTHKFDSNVFKETNY